MSVTPKVLERKPMSLEEARWITLKKLKYVDQDGTERLWECAERTTRKGAIDAVAIFAIIKSKTSAFPPSTIVIEQYRPPIDGMVIEFPAGLVDTGESPEQAAIRELEEETGYKATSVLNSTPVLASDPGMTNANMKLVSLAVDLEGELETPQQKLDQGEHIVIKIVPLTKLQAQLNGRSSLDIPFSGYRLQRPYTAYSDKGFVIDSRLSSFAVGFELASKMASR